MEKKILVGVDGEQKSLEAVEMLGKILKDMPSIQLVLFHSLQPTSSLQAGEICTSVDSKFSFDSRTKIGHAILKEAQCRLAAAGFPENRVETRLKIDGTDPARDILVESDSMGIDTVALGRHGKGQVKGFLMGSVSNKVAQYARKKNIWIVDTPLKENNKVLISVQESPESCKLVEYASECFGGTTSMDFTLMHILPPVPPTLWDDGHILDSEERKDRQQRIERWKSDTLRRMEEQASKECDIMKVRGIPESNLKRLVRPAKEGIALDTLNEIEEHGFSMVILGRNAPSERRANIIGGQANRVLQGAKGAIICLVDL
jgi:nucleotide-binding universal stress UspA family protein